jgi:hypothetical protein
LYVGSVVDPTTEAFLVDTDANEGFDRIRVLNLTQAVVEFSVHIIRVTWTR